MAVISRPGKEGNATTYQGKVAAGYTNILAQEVDADIDAIYSAWNGGVDTVNIKPGSVTAACLAPGAVTGGALAPGSITSAALAANSVTSAAIANGTIVAADIAPGTLTDSLIANVAWTKLIAPYINQIIFGLRCSMDSADGVTVNIWANASNSQQYDGTKPTWLFRLDYTNDQLIVERAPPPGTTLATVFTVTGAGRTVCNLADLSVARNQLVVNAIAGSSAFIANPASFVLSTAGVWTTVVTLPSMTTRGGLVLLLATPTLSATGPAGGQICYQRWLRDGTQVIERSFQMGGTGAIVPLSGINHIDSAPAGAHVYAFQVMVTGSCTIVASGAADGIYEAVELG